MNKFLRINKKLLIGFLIVITIIFFTSIFLEKKNILNIKEEILLVDPKFDIVNPSFTINNNKEKITVKANKGNFINDNLILLKKNVFFESPNFKIFSDEVTFDKKTQIAKSNSQSKFQAQGTEIHSEGFSIIEEGNIILFNGKTFLVITQ